MIVIVLLLCLWSSYARAQDAPEPEPSAEDPSAEYPSEAGTPIPTLDLTKLPRAYDRSRAVIGAILLTGTPFEGAHAGGGWGYGGGISLGFSRGKWPISGGIEILGALYGSDDGRIKVEDRTATYGAKFSRHEAVGFYNLWVRLQPVTWKVRPYVDGIAGIKTVKGSYSLKIDGTDDWVSQDSDRQLATTLGVGVGIDFVFRERWNSRSYVTIGYRWLHGSEVEYAKTIANDSGVTDVMTKLGTTTSFIMAAIAMDADVFSYDSDADSE